MLPRQTERSTMSTTPSFASLLFSAATRVAKATKELYGFSGDLLEKFYSAGKAVADNGNLSILKLDDFAIKSRSGKVKVIDLDTCLDSYIQHANVEGELPTADLLDLREVFSRYQELKSKVQNPRLTEEQRQPYLDTKKYLDSTWVATINRRFEARDGEARKAQREADLKANADKKAAEQKAFADASAVLKSGSIPENRPDLSSLKTITESMALTLAMLPKAEAMAYLGMVKESVFVAIKATADRKEEAKEAA